MEPELPSEDFLFLLSGWWWWWWVFLQFPVRGPQVSPVLRKGPIIYIYIFFFSFIYRAILRYYRCDTPYRAILFEGG